MNDEIKVGETVPVPANPRRAFLKQAGLATGGVALLGATGRDAAAATVAAAAGPRTNAAGLVALELDGQMLGFLASCEGGYARGEVISERPGADGFAKKHLASIGFDDIVLQLGPVLPAALHEWVAAMLAGTPTMKSGAIVSVGFDHRELKRLEFVGALISEISFPPLDASSRTPAYVTIKLRPERTTVVAGSNAPIAAVGVAKGKTALTSNFRLTIPGLDSSGVLLIDPPTATQLFAPSSPREVGSGGPAGLAFQNLTLTLAESRADSYLAWYQDFLIAGKSGDADELPGTLELLGPDLKTVLSSLTFSHLGIFGYRPEKFDAASAQQPRVKIDLYCERFTLA